MIVVIDGEQTWWKQQQGVLSKEIGAIALGVPLYRDVTQNVFLLAAIPSVPSAQYRSPTFPSSQPVVVAWTPLLPGISTAGFPGRIMQAFPGDTLLGMIAPTRGCVVVTWLRQGTRMVQICDASQGQLAIGNADSVELAYFVEMPASDPAAIAALIRLQVVVSPGGSGRVSTARLSTSLQDLSAVGPASALISLANWTRCKNFTWHVALAVIPLPAVNVPMLLFLDAFGVPISTYVPLAITPGVSTQGVAWGLIPNRADWPPGAINAVISVEDGLGFSSLSADVVAEC